MGTPLSPDEIEQFKRLRDLSSPTEQTTAINDFAKWLFASVGTVTGLSLAFAGPIALKLTNYALLAAALAVLSLGVSLGAATVVLATGLPDVNYESLSQMREAWNSVLYKKRRSAKVAGVALALALVLAASAPLISAGFYDATKGSTLLAMWQLSAAKEAVRLTGKIVGPPGARVAYGAVAVSKAGNRDVLAGIGRVLTDGMLEMSPADVAIASEDSELELWLQCSDGSRHSYRVVLKPSVKYSGGDPRAWTMCSCPL